jgi:small-conductance mechanosensitive channel
VIGGATIVSRAVRYHDPAEYIPAHEAPAVRHLALKRALMAGATAFISINLWTGAPLIALWVGSQFVGKTVLSMKAVVVVIVVLAVLVFSMAVALSWLNATYDRLTGRRPRESRVAWLRGMGADEQSEPIEVGMSSNALERIVMVSVYVAVITLLVWFFAFARSPLPH